MQLLTQVEVYVDGRMLCLRTTVTPFPPLEMSHLRGKATQRAISTNTTAIGTDQAS